MRSRLVQLAILLIPTVCQAFEETPAKAHSDPFGLLIVAGLLAVLVGVFVWTARNANKKDRKRVQ